MELQEKLKNVLLKNAEQLAKDVIEVGYDDAVELAKAKLKEAIPGTVDDAVIEMVAAALVPALKTALLEQIQKIHTEAA
jgi:hypothetical protein